MKIVSVLRGPCRADSLRNHVGLASVALTLGLATIDGDDSGAGSWAGEDSGDWGISLTGTYNFSHWNRLGNFSQEQTGEFLTGTDL